MKQNLLRVIGIFLIAASVMVTGCSGPGGENEKSGGDATPSGELKPFPEITLLYNTSEGHKKIAEAIAGMWSDELGIKVQLSNSEWKVYLKNVQVLDYDISRAGWIGDYMDPVTFLDMFVTDGGNNQTGWGNEEYDLLLAQAEVEPDAQKRFDILAKAENILINDALPIIPIYYYVNQNVVKLHVKGMAFNLRDLHPLKYVHIEEGGKVLPPEEQVFRFNNGTEPETIDPGLMTGGAGFNIAMQLFEGLLQYDKDTLKPIPAIATHYDLSDDKKTYTFHLRKDALWSNGDPVTARDFLYSWKRVLEPATGAEYAYLLYLVKNGKPYNTGQLKDFSQVGIRVIDDYTLEVELENPTHYWPDLTAFHTLLPVNRKCVEKYGDRWTRQENIVTNGPFLLKEWAMKDKIVMVKNPDFYEADSVVLQKIIVFAIEDNVSSLNMFKADETDWIRTIPLSDVDEIREWPESHITPFLATYYYRVNVTKPPLDDPRVRKALNIAINKADICEYVTKAGQTPATTFVPPNMPGYSSPKGMEYDPEKARALLKEAGYQVSQNN